MITELVLLLGVLAFLGVRSDHIRRRCAYVVAVLLWGTARLLTEITFKQADGSVGGLVYDWGSVSACLAALALMLCVLAVFVACLPRRQRNATSAGSHGSEAATSAAAAAPLGNASERIRQLVPGAE